MTCVCVWLGAVWVESGGGGECVGGLDQGRERWGRVMSV